MTKQTTTVVIGSLRVNKDNLYISIRAESFSLDPSFTIVGEKYVQIKVITLK